MAHGRTIAHAYVQIIVALAVSFLGVRAASAGGAVPAFCSTPHSSRIRTRTCAAYRKHAGHAGHQLLVDRRDAASLVQSGHKNSHAQPPLLLLANSSPTDVDEDSNKDQAAHKPISTADSLRTSSSSSSRNGSNKNTKGGEYRYNYRYPSRRRLFASTRRKSLPKWFRRLLMGSKFSSMATRVRESSAAMRKGEGTANNGGAGGKEGVADLATGGVNGDSHYGRSATATAHASSSTTAGSDTAYAAIDSKGAVVSVVAGRGAGDINANSSDDDGSTNAKRTINERQRAPLPGSRALRLILSAPLVEFKLSLLVLLSSVFVAAGTVAGLPAPIHAVMNVAEDGIALLFLLEYLLRWYCNGLRLSHLYKPLVMVDFLSVLPLATNLVTSLPFGTIVLKDNLLVNLRLLRLLRFQRFLVDFETFERFQIATGLRFGQDVRKYHLQLARVILTIFTLLTVSAGLVYTAEHVVNPSFTDIPSSLYFIITTVTTVGFGDITPVTALGRMAVCATILAGAAIIPLQVTAFVDALLDFRRDLEAKKSLSKKKGSNGDFLEDELLYEETDVLQADGSYKRIKTNNLLACSICEEKPHREKARYCWACGSPLTLSKWGNLRGESNSEALT